MATAPKDGQPQPQPQPLPHHQQQSQQHAHAQPGNPGLTAGILGLVKNLLGLIISRIELASLEMSEIGINLVRFAVVFVLAAVALWFAIAFWSVLVVVLAWEAWGWRILALLGLVFTIATVGLVFYARAVLAQGKLSLPQTMSELRKDRDALL